MAWWKRSNRKAEETVSKRALEVPRVDPSKTPPVRLGGMKPISRDDRFVVENLKSELMASGVIDRESETLEAADDGVKAFQAAGEQGVKATRELPTYDADLDEFISTFTGGENHFLSEVDEDEDMGYDVYEENGPRSTIRVKDSNGSVELRLPDGSVFLGHKPKA